MALSVEPFGTVVYDDANPDLDFGDALGYVKGVPAGSNIDDAFFSGESTYIDGMYVGYLYQCVEYARRFLIVSRGVSFSECLRAAEIFDKTEVDDVETGEKLPFIACANGETTRKPEVGDLIIYPYVPDVLPWGHVAVISAVGDDFVGIAEQNQANKSWQGKPYGRTCKLLKDAETGKWTIQEILPDTQIRPCRGWMQVEGKAPRAPISPAGSEGGAIKYAPLKIHDKFKTKRGHPTWAQWRLPSLAAPDADLSNELADVAKLNPSRDSQTEATAPGACRPGPVREYQNAYEPSEVAAVGLIPATTHSFRLIGECHKALVAGMTDEQVAERYQLPVSFVPAAKRQLSDFRHGSLGGGLVFALDDATETYTVVDVRLDSMDRYGDMALSAAHSTAYGLPGGWKMSTSNENLNRAVRLIAQRKHALEHRKAPINTIVYFLEIDDDEQMPLASVVSPTAASDYARERAHMRYAFSQYRDYLVDKKAGGVDEDSPVFGVQRVSLFDADLAIDLEAKAITYKGAHVDFLWKTGSWELYFDLLAKASAAGGYAKFKSFMDFVAADLHQVPTVFQPLWAHMLRVPGVMRDVAQWAPDNASSDHRGYAPALEHFSAEGEYVGPLHQPHAVNPMKTKFRQSHPDGAEDASAIAILGFTFDGYQASSIALEARVVQPSHPASVPRLRDATHSAVIAFNFEGDDFAADPDAEKAEEGKPASE